MSKFRGNIIKAVDKWLPQDIPEVWNWKHTTEMLHPDWKNVFNKDGQVHEHSNLLKKLQEPLPYIFLVPLFSDEYCDWLIKKANESDKWCFDNKDDYAAFEIPLKKMNPWINSYHEEVICGWVLNSLYMGLFGYRIEKVSKCFLIKYTTQGGYRSMDMHHDGSSLLSVSISLNDGYEGGGMTFVRNPDQEIEILKGHALLFSGNPITSHRANPVTKGEKYSLVYWIK